MIYLLNFVLFVFPSFYYPWSKIPYEVPKVWLYLRFIEVFLVGLIFSSTLVMANIKNILRSNIFKGIISFLVLALFTSLFGVDFGKSIYGNYYRSDGLITLFHLVTFSIIISFLWQKNWKKPTSVAIFIGSLLAGLLDNFGQPNFLAGYLLISLPFGLYLIDISQKRIIKMLLFTMLLVQTYFIYKTGSWVGLTGILILFPLWKSFLGKIKASFIIVSISILLISILLWVSEFNKSNSNPTSYIAEGRERIYRNVFMGAIKRPLMGYGWANTDYAFESVTWPVKFNSDVYVDKAHMYVLEIFATTGIFGVILYLYILVNIFRTLGNKMDKFDKTTLVSLILYLIHSQTNVTSISQEFIFWLIVGYTVNKNIRIEGNINKKKF